MQVTTPESAPEGLYETATIWRLAGMVFIVPTGQEPRPFRWETDLARAAVLVMDVDTREVLKSRW